MIYIKKDKENKCVFTLTEKSTMDSPYILSLYSNANRDVKLMFLNEDKSMNTLRYNQYNITEVEIDDEDLEDQLINLQIGTYDYQVYQTPTPTLLDISGLDNSHIIETGKLVVIGEKTTNDTFVDTNPNTEISFK